MTRSTSPFSQSHEFASRGIPSLLDQDAEQWVLEISLVSPPSILDFAAANLDKPPAEIESAKWLAEKRRMFGAN